MANNFLLSLNGTAPKMEETHVNQQTGRVFRFVEIDSVEILCRKSLNEATKFCYCFQYQASAVRRLAKECLSRGHIDCR